jgi:hypothetical protein
MHLPAAFRILYLPTELKRKLREGGERAGKLMAEAKGINPEIAPEVTEEVKEATAKVVEKILPPDWSAVGQLEGDRL